MNDQRLQKPVVTCAVKINGVPHKVTFYKSQDWSKTMSSKTMTDVLEKHMVQALVTCVHSTP